MKTLQAICWLALSQYAFGQQQPLTAGSVDGIIAHETKSSEPPVQTEPAFKDPFERKGAKLDPAMLELAGFVGDPEGVDRHVTSVEEGLEDWPEPIQLSYATYKATTYNQAGDFYTYKNIRYAAPPLGPLRFAAPQPPLVEEGIQDGRVGGSCIQAFPTWMITSLKLNEWLIKTIFGTHTDTEDCLFLDVKVPKGAKDGDKLPVIVWIFGGGYVFGKKDFMPYNPTGLFKRTDGNMIYVAMNYRMGAYGFLTGPQFSEEGGVANAALHDQRFAIKWVEDNIKLFGGDPENITIMGESAGGGSVLHQLIWQDPKEKKAPFHRAIPQSPAWVPVPGGFKAADDLQDKNYQEFLDENGCSTLQCLRDLPSWSLQEANELLVEQSAKGTFNFGPSVDGKYIPDLPGKMLKEKKVNQDIEVMVGLVGMEGNSFADKTIQNPQEMDAYLKSALPLSSFETRQKIQDMYPLESYNNSYEELAIFLAGEAFINCNSYFLANAYHNQTYHYLLNYQFIDAKVPAGHGADVGYTFWNNWPLQPVNGFLANALQKYLIGFWTNGDPNSQKIVWGPKMRKWGAKAEMLQLDGRNWLTHVEVSKAALERCAWWQDAHYANPDEHD